MNPVTSDDLPPFLYGTFDWLRRGVFIAGEPPLDLLSAEALRHPNPWIVVAAVLERGKVGEHGHAERLQPFFERDAPFALNRVALLIAGMTAASADLGLIALALASTSPVTRIFAAQGAREAGVLELIPAMVEAWNKAQMPQHRTAIAQAICDMLEDEGGELGVASNYYTSKPVDPAQLTEPRMRAFAVARRARAQDPDEFPQLVAAAYSERTARFGASAVAVWAGELREPRALAAKCLATLPEAETASHLIHYRRTFEASTGTNCDRFFHWTKLRRLVIQATLEEFIHADQPAYTPGVRYFFDHPVP